MNRFQSDALAGPKHIVHGFYGRRGGVSLGDFAGLNCGYGSGDDPNLVRENRLRIARDLGASEDRLLTVYQIHSADAVTVTAPWLREEAPKADGMVTNVRGLALGVLAADCAPVLFADHRAGVIGCAHAGWQGAFRGIVMSVVTRMEALGANRNAITACVGPCISQRNYEVGPEFHARFVASSRDYSRFFTTSGKDGHWLFDLPGFVLLMLKDSGVSQAVTLSLCTYADEPGFFSFRRTTHRNDVNYGRNLSAIMLAD